MGKFRARRCAPTTEKTRRTKAIAACAAHLSDLKRAHGRPPPDVEVASGIGHVVFSRATTSSYCTSPADLCADFAGEFAQ
jgi:hypothetical protein